MASILAFVKRHPVVTYFALVFALSWGPFFLLGGPRRFSGQADPLFMLVLMVSPIAPAVAGLLLTSVVAGQAGLRELRARMLRWRVGVGW